eukprot:COSAG02_NODE_21273_length_795_cov_1.558908_2_plen_45_part_01
MIFVPGFALAVMAKAHYSGNAQDIEFAAKYDWLCGRYKPNMYWWD